MNDKDKTEFIGVLWSIAILASVMLIPAAIISGCHIEKRESDFDKYLRDNQCKPFSADPTGNKIYCGKACFRDEMRHDYICKDDKHLIRIQ